MQLFNEDDQRYMLRALELARKAEGCTSPNPLVGAVLVKDGVVVGEGYHQKCGEAHAEVHALAAAGEQARGATLYINLEPCCHHGRTPPCADSLIAAGIHRAVVAMADPNPLVAGNGLSRLQAAGIDTAVGLMEDQALRLNEAFVKYIKEHRPFVIMKAAMTLDGKIATASGASRWISNEKSRAFVHQLRNVTDAILVGIGTVLKDDPLLNTRLPGGGGRNPIRIVLDGELCIPRDCQIARTAADIKTVVFCAESAAQSKEEELRQTGMEIIRLASQPAALDLDLVLDRLGSLGITSLLVEGGGEVNASFLLGGYVDKVIWVIAPKIFGGQSAPSPVGGRGMTRVEEAVRLENVDVRLFDEDICVTAYIQKESNVAKR